MDKEVWVVQKNLVDQYMVKYLTLARVLLAEEYYHL